MRVSRIVQLGAAIVLLSAIPVIAAPAIRVVLLVQPAHVDLDRDGRADTAAGVPTFPSVVRVTLSRTGIREIAQPAPVLAIAGLDYDRDGDIDLLVGTSEGALLWVNDGHGVFSTLPILLSAAAPVPPSSAWVARRNLTETGLDRDDPAIAHNDRDGPRRLEAQNVLGNARDSLADDFRFSQSFPRAPPRS
jgi:hypothetical protein